MPEVICNTSPLQYLHQLALLDILRALAGQIIVPAAVVGELAEGRSGGFDVPDPTSMEWISIRTPSTLVALPLVKDLGPGETQVLALGLELPDSVVVIDDRLGRQMAEFLGLNLTGTLGLLIDAKHAGLIDRVTPLLDRLQELRFRLSARTRLAVLRLTDEL